MAGMQHARLFQGKTVIVAPHMDDEVLACGGMIAHFPDKRHLYCVYVTDGARSPVPAYPWQGQVTVDLPSVRKQEARNAMSILGIPEANLSFLDLPDGKLRQHKAELGRTLKECLARLNPSLVLIPFRYDRHPDHIAVNHAVSGLRVSAGLRFDLLEYFVYYRWRLLPGGDVRRYVRSDQLIEVDVSPHSSLKQEALQSYRSQATRFFPWQTRPILPQDRVEEVSQSPEFFLHHDPSLPAAAIFSSLRAWILFDHLLEPFLKNCKAGLLGILKR